MSARRPAVSEDATAIERAAAEWALRVQSGLRGDEQREFQAWLEGDARHAASYAAMDETSRLLDQLRDPALATENVVPFEAPFVPEATAEPGPAIDGPPKRRHWILPIGLAAAAIVMLVAILGPKLRTTRENYTASFLTDVGGSRTVNLPDGSVLRLNTDSVVEAVYTPAERRVRLKRGEAFFSVAKNPRRPFWVEVGGVSVRAVGTAFNVRFRSQSVEVLVKEGKVSVNRTTSSEAPANVAAEKPAPATERLLVAGEQATVTLPAQAARELPPVVVASMTAPRLESALAWQQGRLEFTDTPLAEVVAEFNRYNRQQLTIADSSLGAEPFGGTFSSQGYEAFIEVLEQSFGVVAERHGNETILRRRSTARRAN